MDFFEDMVSLDTVIQILRFLGYISGLKVLLVIMKIIVAMLIQPNIVVEIDKPESPKKRSVNWKKIIDNQIEDRVNVSKINE